MNVVHIIEYFNVAGAENVVKTIVTRCGSPLTNHKVIVLNEIGINGNILKEKGFSVFSLHRKSRRFGFFRTLIALARCLNQCGADIIHAHNYAAWVFAAFINLFYGKTLVLTLHGMPQPDASLLKRVLFHFLVWRTRRIICVSEDIHAYVTKISPRSGTKSAIIINGIDLTSFEIPVDGPAVRRELGLDQSAYLLVTVTRFYPIKNIERQIHLLANLVHEIPDLYLLIAARPIAYAEKIKGLASSLGVAERVIFLGLRHDVPRILKASDLFILSSFSEGTSLALMEAIAAGLPVVASNVGGNVRLVQHGINGFLFDLDREGDFEEKVLSLYHDRELARSFAHKQASFAQAFSERHMISQYRALYHFF